MATLGSSITLNCPMCGEPITLQVEATKMIHTKITPGSDVVTMRASLRLTFPELDNVDLIPADHFACFTVSDADRAAILEYEANAPRDPEDT